MLIISRGLVNSGAIQLITRSVIDAARPLHAHIATMGGIGAVMSGFMNNVAALALLMPVDIQTAKKAGRAPGQPDPFLMAVAVSASCAFLTPIGHKNNTLILGPGGYSFGDYWRMGLPLEIIVIAVPMILLFWPF